MDLNSTSCIIVGGGSGSRFSSHTSKLHINIAGKPVYIWAIENFMSDDRINEIVVVGPFSIHEIEHWMQEPQKIVFAQGGKSRTESVFNGLCKCKKATQWVLIHDAARPFIPFSMLDRIFHAAKPNVEGVIPVLPIYDSLKRMNADNLVLETVSKKDLVRAQTPQLYQKKILLDTFEERNGMYEDESQLLLDSFLSAKVKCVPGSYIAEKITDLPSRVLIERMISLQSKTGIGWDFHPFQEGRDLVLGGVLIPNHCGLEGDSDGDVITHAVIDALLGALGLGDIGSYFGVKKPELMGVRSLSLLEALRNKIFPFFWEVTHVDITVVGKTPHIHPYSIQMKKNLARCLQISDRDINIKATTDKDMDAAGQGKGIRVVAVATIQKTEESYG
ncbi:MAG TPA: 2-C-methyl-D-erythritol 2,4-cyclodiphosphate synthase [Caldisericia bacterium]|nr:2-C-methyl-D-erythritol 2,4-cyclodiphosphate synthase [Caldisericia bacterium]HXK52037.1 2-C-methyl-D-erythritol 2,4-cyclodiphosphate synthase [Caldisericia bacterium]